MYNIPKIAPNADLKALEAVLRGFTHHQRREWFIKANMSSKGLTYQSIGIKYNIIPWFISAQVVGKYSLSPRLAMAFEECMGVDMLPFMSFKEQTKYYKMFPERLNNIG